MIKELLSTAALEKQLTQKTVEALNHFLDYWATHPEAVALYLTSNMILLLKYIEAECIIRSMCYYDNRQRSFNCYNANSNCYF